MSRASGVHPLQLLDGAPGDFAALLQIVVAAEKDRDRRTMSRDEAIDPEDDPYGIGRISGRLQTIAEEA